jgi:BirA family biotin operon repressor/biotin-[acetyl-CoA-carboxylase] ligase
MSWNCILERVVETKSTNDDLLGRWRAGELIDPVARIAQNQTAGKGRAGRSWFANPEDSLCFSLAYPFQRSPAELSGLSLLVGLAVLQGIANALVIEKSALYTQGLRLKWPNDLLLNNAKLGGILIEGGQAKAGDPTWMIIGVGINLRHAKAIQNRLTYEASFNIASLDQLLPSSIKLPDTEVIWLKLIESFERHLPTFDQKGFALYQDQWMEWDAFKETEVCISGAGKEPVFGIAKGVDSNGALLLEQATKTVTIHAGDVSLRAKS